MLLWIIVTYLGIGFLIETVITDGDIWAIKKKAKSGPDQKGISWYLGYIVGILLHCLIWPYWVCVIIKVAYEINKGVES